MQPAIYQLVLLGAGRAEHAGPLVEELTARLQDMGGDLSAALKVFDGADASSVVPTAPAVAVYFGDDPKVDEQVVGQLQSLAMPILPAVSDLDNFDQKVPPELAHINGLAIGNDSGKYVELVNVVLENLSLLRRRRRLFISYFRKESTPIAHQLRVAFDDRGYDTFLDTSSVPKGDDFQAVLWHRLLDSDVLVVLDTPSFLTSRWTREELAQASAMSVGMLRVVWPGVARERTAELALHHYLDPDSFDEDELTDDAVKEIVTAAEGLRARCVAARHTNLIQEFCIEAKRIGAKIAVQPTGYVLTHLNGRKIAVIPAVGVPDAQRYHEASSRFPTASEHADEAILIYDHRGMMSEWCQFLDWLDDYLPVKGMRVTETAAKLAS